MTGGPLIIWMLVLAPFLPVALATAIVTARGRSMADALLPFAALPALAVAVLPAGDYRLVLPEVLLGLELGLRPDFDSGRRLFLVFTALLWTAAGIYGRGYLGLDGNRHRYNAFFLLTMSGSLGLILARDVPGFYLFFSLMTLASYLLVVFERTPSAYRAGRVYIVLSLLGETLLLLGFLRAVDAAGSVLIADTRAALASGPADLSTLWLLFGGFAIKAGLIPLHVWLPLAHPAAPTPASAVLSGAMIKAGLLGMMLFLPVGEASLPRFGMAVIVIGFATAFYGVACGLPQVGAKAVLAYSSLSQMGLMVAALGSVLVAPQAGFAILPAIVIYAMHHGLTKAALFFSVGVIDKAGAGRRAALVLAALGGLAIAGAPLTGGAIVKQFLKEGLGGPETALATVLVTLLTLSALATALLMFRFVFVVLQGNPRGSDHDGAIPAGGKGAGAWMWTPFVATALLGQALPWSLLAACGHEPWETAASAQGLWLAFWPPAAALLVGGAALLLSRRWARGGRAPRLTLPPGDWLALLPTRAPSAEVLGEVLRQFASTARNAWARLGRAMVLLLERLARTEGRLGEQLPAAAAVAAAALAMVLALGA